MLPWIAVGVGTLIIASIFSDEKSKNSSARRRYHDTVSSSTTKIKKSYHNSARKDKLDKLHKTKFAKVEISQNIYNQLKKDRKSLKKLNFQIRDINKKLKILFSEKKIACNKYIKREINKEITINLNAKEQLILTRDMLQKNCSNLKNKLDETNKEVQSIKKEISLT